MLGIDELFQDLPKRVHIKKEMLLVLFLSDLGLDFFRQFFVRDIKVFSRVD